MSDSIKSKFSDQEWFEISCMPTMVGAAMAGAGKSGIIGTTKEAMANMKAIVAGRTDYPNNQLIAAILEKADSFSDARERAGSYREMAVERMKENNIKTPEQFNTFMLDHCDRAIALVGANCSVTDTTEYQQWAKNVAEKVASAASEGGFMGFGGERVSEPERQLLAQIEERFSTTVT